MTGGEVTVQGAPGVFIDVIESSAEESADNLSPGPREIGMVSTGRSAVSSEWLEVGFCAVIRRGQRTPVDVRRGDRWVGGGNDVGQWPWGIGSGAGKGMDSSVSCRWRVSHEIGKSCRNFGNGRLGAVSRIKGERRGERRGRVRRARALRSTPQTNRLNKGANPRSSG